MTDGRSPASAVLKDGNAVYTPGLSEHRGSTSKFYHGDALGSTRGITDSTQAVTDSQLYDAFGNTVSRTGTTPTPFGFVGKAQYQSDSDSGLQLLGHRYYDPSIGRFLSQDPIRDGTNWYAYCDNNPLKMTDPTGLKPPTTWWQWAQDGGAAIAVPGAAVGVWGILTPDPGPSKIIAAVGGIIATVGGVIWIIGKLGEYADPGTPVVPPGQNPPSSGNVPAPGNGGGTVPTPIYRPPYSPPVAPPPPPPIMSRLWSGMTPEPPYQGGSGGAWKDPDKILPPGTMGGGYYK